ncbi:hypothetical protein BC628DRAFT_923151 [Trametes gibbosa]|nr:hypothetical protein BC628DRAFT_923151 [Trametes gibbosa]
MAKWIANNLPSLQSSPSRTHTYLLPTSLELERGAPPHPIPAHDRTRSQRPEYSSPRAHKRTSQHHQHQQRAAPLRSARIGEGEGARSCPLPLSAFRETRAMRIRTRPRSTARTVRGPNAREPDSLKARLWPGQGSCSHDLPKEGAAIRSRARSVGLVGRCCQWLLPYAVWLPHARPSGSFQNAILSRYGKKAWRRHVTAVSLATKSTSAERPCHRSQTGSPRQQTRARYFGARNRGQYSWSSLSFSTGERHDERAGSGTFTHEVSVRSRSGHRAGQGPPPRRKPTYRVYKVAGHWSQLPPRYSRAG